MLPSLRAQEGEPRAKVDVSRVQYFDGPHANLVPLEKPAAQEHAAIHSAHPGNLESQGFEWGAEGENLIMHSKRKRRVFVLMLV